MQYLYSALILQKTGQEITETAIGKILKAAGTEADKARIKSLVAALGEIDIEEALASAMAMPMAAAPAAGGGAATADTGSAPAAAEEEEEEEEEEGEEVDDDDDGLGSLFG